MNSEKKTARAAPGRYQAKPHRRWPMRIVVALLSVGGMLGLWQFVAHEQAASAKEPPSIQDAEQQLQLSGGLNSSQGTLSAPNTVSGTS